MLSYGTTSNTFPQPTLVLSQAKTQEQQSAIAEFKLLILGDKGVGKTSLINRFTEAQVEKKYLGNFSFEIGTIISKKTKGIEVSSIFFETNIGIIKFQIWDAASQEDMGKAYYLGANCALIMFDVTSRITYKNLPLWDKDLTSFCENIPVVIVGNKVAMLYFLASHHTIIRWILKIERSSQK